MAWKGIKPTEYALKMIEDCETEVKRKIIIGLRTCIESSPVQDGAYRGNHIVSINNGDYSFDLNKKDKSGTATLNEGLSKIAQVRISDTVYIQNNLPYAVRLENGWSADQAPMGVYSIAFMNMRTV